MPLTVSDLVLEQAGLTEEEGRLEFACRLFQSQRLSLWQAAQCASLARLEMEAALLRRGIPIYEVTEAQLRDELAAMDRLGIPG